MDLETPEMAVRQDIRRRLLDTGAFAEVRVTGPPEEYGFAASSFAAAFMAIPSARTTPRWDGGEATGQTKECRLVVTLMSRDADPELRDLKAEQLLSTLEQAVNGQSLAGITVGDHTYVETSRPLVPKAPERRIEAVVIFQYIISGWGGPVVSQQ